jgi:polyferredoxin
MVAIGSYTVAPYLPVLRFDYPGLPGTITGGQRVCNIGIEFRALTTFWPMTLLIVSIGILIFICIMLGRALCGWLCPIGLVQDLLTKTRTTLKFSSKEVSRKTHERLVLVKYSILILAFILAGSLGLSLLANETAGNTYKAIYPEGTSQIAPYCSVCPAPDIHYIGTIINTRSLEFSDKAVYFGLFVIFCVFIFGILMPRFWCRYFCPMGALSSCFNKVSILSIQKDHTKCTKCNYCVNACDMRVYKVKDEDKYRRVTDTNCMFCLECIESCPDKALSLSFGGKKIYHGGKSWWL